MIGSPKAIRQASPTPSVETGMRRVSWVRITVDERGAHCQVHGVGHRFPSTRRVSLKTALALSAQGVPTIVRPIVRPAEKLRATG